MLANVGKRHQHWPMSPNCQKKIHPWVRRRRQKNLKVQKNFKCQVGPFFSNFWMFWTIRDPNLEKINKKKLFSLFPPHHNMAGGQLKKQGFTVNVVCFFKAKTKSL